MTEMSHTVDLEAIPEIRELIEFVANRLAVAPQKAATTQPEFERGLRKATLRVERAVHSLDFERMDVDVPGIVVDGKRYARRKEKTIGHYTTLAGPMEVKRTTYRARGGHGGETIAALDLRLGLLDGHWTLVAAEVGSSFVASLPSAEAATLLESAGTMTPSASHLDRLTKHVGAAWDARREEFEAAVREAERLELPSADNVHLLVVSLDGIMVPMKDAPRTPGAGRQDCGPKGHKEAGCGTIAVYSETGERLWTIRWGQMPEAHKLTLQKQLAAELAHLQRGYPAAKVVALADGAKDNWRILREIAEELGIEVRERLDFFHAAENLTEGLRAGGLDAEERSTWRKRLQGQEGAVEPIIEELGLLAAKTRGKKKRKTLESAFGYFINNADRVDYAEATAANEPIGSGVQEAACKTLVADRMKRSGMTWRHRGGQAVLTLRSLGQSNRLHHAWAAMRPTMVTRFDVDTDPGRKRPARYPA